MRPTNVQPIHKSTMPHKTNAKVNLPIRPKASGVPTSHDHNKKANKPSTVRTAKTNDVTCGTRSGREVLMPSQGVIVYVTFQSVRNCKVHVS